MAENPLGLTELDALIQALYAAKLDALKAMQSVSRPGLSYDRVQYRQICDDLSKALRDRERLTGGGALIQTDIEGSIPQQVNLQDQFRNPDSPT